MVWPSAANLNSSVGNITITVGSKGLATYSGNVVAGAFTTAELQGQYQIVSQSTVNQGGNKVTVQQVVSTSPLELLENFG